MLAISRPIEDEAAATAGHPLFTAGFQTEHRYRRAEPRWDELARTSAATLVFADFTTATNTPQPGPYEVALPPDAALRRERFVACDGDGCTAALAGWELPTTGTPTRRCFEATWTTEPATVAHITATALRLARTYTPALHLPDPDTTPRTTDPRATSRQPPPSPTASSATSTGERPGATSVPKSGAAGPG